MTKLEARDLHVRLGPKDVLQGVSAAFTGGQLTAVVGPNGAGKSTLLACLAGLRRPDRGDAMLDEASVLTLPARPRAQRIGFLPQFPEVAWPVDARTFVGLGRTPYTGARGLSQEDEAAVERALETSGTVSLSRRIVTSLSGGERARVLLARALAGEPAWLLADEPLTGLDPGYQLDVAHLLRQLARDGRGVVVTMHDLHMALAVADRVLMLAEGRVVADDTPTKALTPEILAKTYGVKARYWDGEAGPLIEILGRRV